MYTRAENWPVCLGPFRCETFVVGFLIGRKTKLNKQTNNTNKPNITADNAVRRYQCAPNDRESSFIENSPTLLNVTCVQVSVFDYDRSPHVFDSIIYLDILTEYVFVFDCATISIRTHVCERLSGHSASSQNPLELCSALIYLSVKQIL